MSQYQRIFLIADSAMQRTPAFERAANLARTTGADLHIAIFDHDRAISAAAVLNEEISRLARRAWIDQRRNWLLSQAALTGLTESKVSVDVVWGKEVLDEILMQIADWKPDVVVKDVHHESLLRRVLLKPLDWQLLRRCPVPLLLVNSIAHVTPRRVLAAVDVSRGAPVVGDLNDSVIRSALALSIQCDAELHLVYAFMSVNAVIGPMGEGLMYYAELYDQLLKMHRENFDALAKAHSVPADRAHFLIGPSIQTVADFAQQDSSDVVVIGTARHSIMDRLLLGTSAEALLDCVPCNVLAVKP